MSYAKDLLIQIQEGSEEDRDLAALEYLQRGSEADAIDASPYMQRLADASEAIVLESIKKLDHAMALAHADFREKCAAARIFV